MYTLTVDAGPAVTASEHPDRDAAHRALMRYVVAADYYLHPIHTGPAHTTYELLALPDPDDRPGPQQPAPHRRSRHHRQQPADADAAIMTTQPRPLHAVPECDGATDTAADDRWRGETVAAQWEPESQLVGALMWLPAARARTILEVVPDTAIWRPLNRWAYEIIRDLVDAGRDPEPVSVLAHARHRPAAESMQPDRAPTPGQHHRLAVHLADLYTHTITPTAAGAYAREVLHEAYRRAFGARGIRMQQLAEGGAGRAELTEQFAAIRDELADLWRRAEAAAQPGWDAT